MLYDIIIVGSGPAGMTAGIYAARRALKVLILSKDIGGQMSKTLIIENYPGVGKINGLDLAFKMQEEAKSFGVGIDNAEVSQITKQNNNFQIKAGEKSYEARAVILAFGLEKKKLGLPEENKFEGKGISYCVTCDGPFFKNKNVVVVGGGNSGAEAVEYLAKICPKVYWLEILKEMKAEPILLGRIKKIDTVEIMTNTQITEFLGADTLTGVKIKTSNEEKKIEVAGVIVEIGYMAKSKWLGNLVETDELGQIKINELSHTKTAGLFAAGDITTSKYKQIVISEGSGAMAALEAYNYIQNNK